MKNPLRSTGALAALALAAAPALAQAQAAPLPLKHAPAPTTAAITAADAMTRLYILADDSMMGREAGTAGNVKGTDYIAREARRIGLEPAGENGTFFQTIPFVRRAIDPAGALSVDGAALRLGDDYLLLPTVNGVFTFNERFSATGAQVVYGGQLGTTRLIDPAQTAGMRTAWVNRHAESTPPGAEPEEIWRDLWGLPRLAGGAGPGMNEQASAQ